MGLMRTSVIAILPLLFLLGSSSESLAADITWKIFLRSQPVYSAVTREGEELVLPRIPLPGTVSSAQETVDALENTRILIPRLPDGNPVEIRVALNIGGSSFDPVRQKTMFLNLTFTPYRDGRPQSMFSLPQAMVLTIPVAGLNALLSQSGFSRSDDITLAFDSAGTFTRNGITTDNRTSGLISNVARLSSTVVGSTCNLLNLPPNKRPGTWGQIKLLFQ